MILLLVLLITLVSVIGRIATSPLAGAIIASRLPPTSSDHVEVGTTEWFEFKAKENKNNCL